MQLCLQTLRRFRGRKDDEATLCPVSRNGEVGVPDKGDDNQEQDNGNDKVENSLQTGMPRKKLYEHLNHHGLLRCGLTSCRASEHISAIGRWFG